jgi:hypothetical protein
MKTPKEYALELLGHANLDTVTALSLLVEASKTYPMSGNYIRQVIRELSFL